MLEFNLPFAEARLARLAQALGVETDALSRRGCRRGGRGCRAPARRGRGHSHQPAHVGVTEETIPQMAADAMTSGNVAINPRPTTLEDITRLYQQAM